VKAHLTPNNNAHTACRIISHEKMMLKFIVKALCKPRKNTLLVDKPTMIFDFLRVKNCEKILHKIIREALKKNLI
jgi:hypothetical protein